MYINPIQRIINAYQHLQNWPNYILRNSPLFVTKPYPIQLEITKPNYPVFKEIFIKDFYQADKVLKNLPEKPVVIDVGANVGFFIALLLSKRPQADIYAIEPLPTNVEKINQLLQANQKIKKQVHLLRQALSDQPEGSIRLFIENDPKESAIASIYQEFDRRNQQTIEVKVSNLVHLISQQRLSHIDVLKLDCEGAEYPILYSTPQEVLEKIQLILLEVHDLDNDKKNLKSLESFLQSKGFAVASNKFGKGSYYTVAKR